MKTRWGIRAKLNLAFIAVFGTFLILFSAFLYQNFLETHQREFDVALYNYTVDIAESVNVNFLGEFTLLKNPLQESEKLFPFSLGEVLLEIRNREGKTLARSQSLQNGEIPLSAEDFTLTQKERILFRTIRLKGRSAEKKDYRVATYFIDKPGNIDFIIQVASPMQLMERERKGLMTFFFFSIPIILLLGSIGTFLYSTRVLKPLKAIIGEARRITARDLTRRVPIPDEKDEIFTLAQALNDLLKRLHSAFDSQAAFVADASHQLKTPLAILKGELDMIQSGSLNPAEMKEFLGSASQEIDYLTRVVHDLLTLARVDSGHASLSFSASRIDEILLEVHSRLVKLAERKGRAVKIVTNFDGEMSQDEFSLNCDPDLIRTMIENLVENAVKHSPEGGTVSIRLEDEKEAYRISIRDQGKGFAMSEATRIFNRFYKISKDQSTTEGSGLGLSIVKKIAELHEGTAEAISEPGQGSQFIVTLPKMFKKEAPPRTSV